MNPRVFNNVIMALYAVNAAWWAYHRHPGQTCYWLSALAITASVTYLPQAVN